MFIWDIQDWPPGFFSKCTFPCSRCTLLLPLQPGTRDRIRSMFAKAGRYSTLEEHDPEGGSSSSVPMPVGSSNSELPDSAAQRKSIELTGNRGAAREAPLDLSQSTAEGVAPPLGNSSGRTLGGPGSVPTS